MELLKDDWTTLFHYRKICTGVLASQIRRERLLKRLGEILDCLSARGMVHGDFRMSC